MAQANVKGGIISMAKAIVNNNVAEGMRDGAMDYMDD